MDDIFLQRSKAKLAIAKLLGFLDRKIRRGLRELSDEELIWEEGKTFQTRIWELASLDSPGKMPSMGARMRIWREHPYKKYLDEEGSRRYDERVAADPDYYRTPFDNLSDAELDQYIIWVRDQPPDTFDRLSVDEKYALWKRVGRKTLPVLPSSGSLPTNANAKRSPNRHGSSGDFREAKTDQASQASNSEAISEGPISLEDREVH